MRLHPPQVEFDGNGTRAQVQIESADPSVGSFRPFFQLPRGWRLDTSVDPFVPLATALASWYGEDLDIEAAVTDHLVERCRRASWMMASHAHQPAPLIRAPTVPAVPLAAGRRTGVLVSRGIDSSLCLVLADRGEIDPKPDVGIVIRGIDYGDLAVFTSRSVDAAREFGLDPVVVTTNAESEIVPRLRYPRVFTAVLAGASLALKHHLSDVVVGSSSTPRSVPIGPHASFQEHLSSDDLRFHQVPESMKRSERVAAIVDDGRPLRWLRVCWRDPVKNCGRCRKCLMTLAMLDACGGRQAAVTFDQEPLDAEDFRDHPPVLEFLDDLIDVTEPQRPDIANVLRSSFDRNDDPFRFDPEPVRLHAIASRPDGVGTPRPLTWCSVSDPAHHLAGAAALQAHQVLGPGLTWHSEELFARPVVERLLGQARLTLWTGPDDEFDVERATLALENGSRPVQVVAPGAAERLAGRLPPSLAPIVRSIDDLGDLADEPVAVLDQLAASFVAGGSGWMRPEGRR